MKRVLSWVGVALAAALAGFTVALAVAAVTTTPALFLAAGAAASMAVWALAARRTASRAARRTASRPAGESSAGEPAPARTGRTVLVAGVVATAAGVGSVLVPLGDPRVPPAPPPGAGSWTLADGGRLAYGVVRAAPGVPRRAPVVVLHGGPGVPDLAGELAALRPLAAAGRDVWAYAQRGAGGSSRLADPSGYTIPRAVADLEQVRLRIGAEKVVLIGHSAGAFLAASYLAEHPGRVERVVYSSPGDLRTAGLGGRPQRRLGLGGQLRLYGLLAPPRAVLGYALVQVNPAAAHAFAGDAEFDARQDRVHAVTLPALHCPELPGPRQTGRQPGPGRSWPRLHGLGFYANLVPQSARAPRPADPAPALAASGVPALVIRGECDYLDWSAASSYVEAVPGTALAYLPGAGHDAYLDRPGDYVAVVAAFLAGRPVPGTLPDPLRPPPAGTPPGGPSGDPSAG